MQAYTGFAQVYDIFMDNVPYDDWTDYLTGLLYECGVKDGLVLELGCGTGNITRRLAARGYDLIGIDYSDEMLEIAREKEYNDDLVIDNGSFSDTDKAGMENEDDLNTESEDYDWETADNHDWETIDNQTGKNPILYLQQDMRTFELYGTVGAVVSICDSMNYITSEEDLLKVFQLVNNYLDPGGIFIFDMNTEYKYKNILSDNTIAENRENCSFIWENYYDNAKQINEYNITIFVKQDEDEQEYDELEDDELADKLGEGKSEEDQAEMDQEEEESEYNSQIQLFERFQETHYQKAYSVDRVKQLIEASGMELTVVYDAFTNNPPTDKSERVYFIVKEKYQENKKYI